jgi:cardiolipin synthase (CMP-forming)
VSVSEPSNRIVTLPNVLSLMRLLLLPVFVWLALVQEADLWAFALLTVTSATDWFDGWIARRHNQVTRLGQLLDPLADRLYVVTTIVVLALRELMPWWVVGAFVARDLFMTGVQYLMRRHGLPLLPVHYVGKAATVCILIGFPAFFLTTGSGLIAELALPVAWAFRLWGLAIYWWSAVLYAEQAHAVFHGRRLDISA